MIVDPDFVDHWKTRMLVGNLGDEAAPIYVLRLWAHCQNRRQSTFESLTVEALKALCRFPGNANKLESSLVASGFVSRDGTALTVCNWDEYNSSLIAAWKNGQRGGRPKSKGRDNPGDNQKDSSEDNPMDNPMDNPGDNPGVSIGLTDKIGVDKSREDKREIHTAEASPPNPHAPSFQDFIDTWNRTFQVKTEPTDKRRKAFKARLQEQSWCRNWLDAIANVRASPFCNGNNDRNWVATIDWFLRPDTVQKAIEGTYNGGKEIKAERPLPREV